MIKIQKILEWLATIVIIVAGLIYLNSYFGIIKIEKQDNNVGGTTVGTYLNYITLAGTTTDAVFMPREYVMDTSTTTDPDQDGDTINQMLYTENVDLIRLLIDGIGSDDSTSTLAIRPQVSNDREYWYDLAITTSTGSFISPTTTGNFGPFILAPIFGTATTQTTFEFDIDGAKYTRFLFKGNEDSDGDRFEKTQAHIEAILVNKLY